MILGLSKMIFKVHYFTMSSTNSTDLQPSIYALTLLCGVTSVTGVYLIPRALQAPSMTEVSKWVGAIYKHPHPQQYAEKLSIVASATQTAGVACGALSLGSFCAMFIHPITSACLLSSAAVAGFGYIGQKVFSQGSVLAAAAQWVLSRAKTSVFSNRVQTHNSVQARLQPLNRVPETSQHLRWRQQNGLRINTAYRIEE